MTNHLKMMTSILAFICKAEKPFVSYVYGTDYLSFERSLLQAGVDQNVVSLNGFLMQDFNGFFEEFSKGFKLPEYFGHNLNALSDLMRDLSWLGKHGFVILTRHTEKILAKERYGLEVLIEHANFYGEHWLQSMSANGGIEGPFPFTPFYISRVILAG